MANPGCFPTAALLALIPLAGGGRVDWDSVVVDAKTGVSGAGRTPRPVSYTHLSPSHYRDADMSLEGLVGDARLARGPEGRTCSFALVSPNSNMGLAILGADAPETGLYVRVEGPLRLDPRLNTCLLYTSRCV